MLCVAFVFEGLRGNDAYGFDEFGLGHLVCGG